MTEYWDNWHKPSFRLAACNAGYEAEAKEGYFVNQPEVEPEAFSSRPCEICGTPLAGQRHLMVRIHPRDPNQNYSGCDDCQNYIEYGQLDDQTMLDIDKEVTG